MRLVSIANLNPKFQVSVVLVNTVAPSQRRRALKVELRAVVVGNRVRRQRIDGGVVDVGSIQDWKLRLV